MHELSSSQLGAVPPAHVPAAHVSAVVQASPSSQGAVLLVFVQPLAGSQPSEVHGLASSQLGVEPPTQEPPEHASFVVQGLPSEHAAELLVCVQPGSESHVSTVHPLASSQDTPSRAHPVGATHESAVHASLSLQLGAPAPTQSPSAQVSTAVQAFPSSQGAALSACVQPVPLSQASSVHTSASEHETGAC